MSKVAVVGSGKWGTNLVRNFLELGALECICEKDEARVRELKKTFEGVPICTDLSTILDNPAVDGVVIATPPNLHHELGMRALKAGKHIFVEKPMTLLVKESLELNKTAKELNRILMVGHILLYSPAYMRLKEVIDSGELGEVCNMHSQRIGLGRVRREENALFSLAPHDISVMLYIMREPPEALSCFGMDYLQEGIADIAYLNMRFSGKRIGHIHVSWFAPVKVRKLTVVGRKKMATVDELVGTGSLTLYNCHIERSTLSAYNGEAEEIELPKDEPLKAECRQFLHSIATGTLPKSDGCQGADVVRILSAADESIKRMGAWIELEKVC